MRKLFLLFNILVAIGMSSHSYASFLLWETLDSYNNGTFNIGDSYFSLSNESRGSSLDEHVGIYYGYKSVLSLEQYAGYYLGTFDGNTDIGGEGKRVKILIDRYLEYYNSKFSTQYHVGDYYKADLPQKITSNSIQDGPLTVTWKNDLMSGTWEFSESSQLSLGFYAVKGAKEFALYFVDPARNFGNWSTVHLKTPNGKNTPTISHFSGVDAVSTTVVPEPESMVLLGLGLLGLVLIIRRRTLQ
jgi:hypothetical protein